MTPAPTPSVIPPAPKHTRQITPTITTCWSTHKRHVTARSTEGATHIAPTEIEALEGLLIMLGTADPEAHGILGALRAAPSTRPTLEEWFTRPLDSRGHKPRRPRYDWIEPGTGKRIHVYKDTMQRYAHMPARNPTDESDHTTNDE